MKLFMKSILLGLFMIFAAGTISAQTEIKKNIWIDSTLTGKGTFSVPLSVNGDSIDVGAAIADSITDLALSKEYKAVLTGANGSFTSATVAKNDLSAAIVWVYTGEGIITGTLTNAFTTDKTTVFLTLKSATGGVVLKHSITSDDAIVINSFLVTDGTTAADFIGTINVFISVEP